MKGPKDWPSETMRSNRQGPDRHYDEVSHARQAVFCFGTAQENGAIAPMICAHPFISKPVQNGRKIVGYRS